MKRKSFKLSKAGIVIAFLLFAVIVYTSIRQYNASTSAAFWVAHTQEVLFHTEKLLVSALEAESNSRGYLLTGQPYFLETFQQSEMPCRQSLEYIRPPWW